MECLCNRIFKYLRSMTYSPPCVFSVITPRLHSHPLSSGRPTPTVSRCCVIRTMSSRHVYTQPACISSLPPRLSPSIDPLLLHSTAPHPFLSLRHLPLCMHWTAETRETSACSLGDCQLCSQNEVLTYRHSCRFLSLARANFLLWSHRNSLIHQWSR